MLTGVIVVFSGPGFCRDGPGFSVEGPGLVNQHYRDIVSDLVDEAAALADKGVFFAQFHRPLAFGAGEYFQQFLVKHDILRIIAFS